MTPEKAVAQLVEIVNANPNLSEDEIYQAMAQRNIPFGFADRAFKFTQIACGRLFLKDMGIKFSPDYVCLDAAGNLIDSGELIENTYFIAAVQSIPNSLKVAAFKRLAMTSADFNVVNNALNAGSKAENLSLSTATIFIETPTEQGIHNAQEMINQELKSQNAAKPSDTNTDPTSKPWWRFWN